MDSNSRDRCGKIMLTNTAVICSHNEAGSATSVAGQQPLGQSDA
jgi:hypothetical protein